MCGIAGIYSSGGIKESDHSDLDRMLAGLIRRGPDGEGKFQQGPVLLGHRRLKILDLTDAGRQPMTSRNGKFTIIFNGECYNFAELRAELGLKPEDMHSHTDTEVLLEAWAAWGEACLPKIVGQFAIVIYDHVEKSLWIARDRFGEKPMYFHRSNGRFIFASSIPSLVLSHSVPRELDSDTLKEFLTLRYVVAPRTVLRGVYKLPPGNVLKITENDFQIKTWYEPHFDSNSELYKNLSKDEIIEEFDRLLRQATNRCLTSDVPVGLLLSNGIDSNAIRSILDSQGSTVGSFTYAYGNDTSEHQTSLAMINSKGVLQPNGVKNHRYSFTSEERLAAMRTAFANYTEPVGDGASLATWLLLQKSREHATVFLCGHGADEFLGGYRLHQDRARFRMMRVVAGLGRMAGTKTLDRYLSGAEPVQTRIRSFRSASRDESPAAARHLIHRPLPIKDFHEMYQSKEDEVTDGYLASIDALYGKCRPGANDLDRMQKVLVQTFLSENILSFADSVAMDASVEVRMPFVDRDLVNFAQAIPSKYRAGVWPKEGNTKLILRAWGAKNMDNEIVNRPKESFDFGSLRPMMAAHGDELRGYVLDSSAIRRQMAGIESWMNRSPDYFRGCWQGTLWALLSLGIWCQANNITD